MTAAATKAKLQTLFNQRFECRYLENADRFIYQTFTKKNQSQDTLNKFIKTLVKFVSENHNDKIMYVKLVADEPNDIRHYRKSLSSCATVKLKPYI